MSPAQDVEGWLRRTLIDGDGPLCNPDHAHLDGATIGVLWTTAPNARHMRDIIGQAEIPQFQGNKWSKARQKQQLIGWFGNKPDFILTFSAFYARTCSDAEWCALVEHELYHCAQRLDDFGAPKFTRDGQPVFGIRGHDVEEFVGVVQRYGAITSQIRAMVDAANAGPTIAEADIAAACGTCAVKT